MHVPPPEVRWLGEDRFRLSRPYIIELRGKTLIIPRGFEMDGASVPRLFWPIMAKTELGVASPLVHDFLYRNGGIWFSRATVDKIFLDMMAAEGVPRWRRWAAYVAVRAAGRHAWRDNPTNPNN